MRESYLAIDLGAQRLAAGVVDASGKVVIRDRVAAPARHAWPVLARLVSRVLAATPEEILPTTCGVSCAGPIDDQKGQIAPAHLSVWWDFPLAAKLADAVGMPVKIGTGGQGFAMAEAWCGSAIGHNDLLAVLLSDVVEAAVLSRGRLLQGHSGNVGNIAHVVVEPGGRNCRCGLQGCLDTYLGVNALEEETSRTLERIPLALVERAGIMLGRAVASFNAIAGPDEILIGGRALQFFGPSFELALRKEFSERSRIGQMRLVNLKVLGPEATSPLIRAAAIARSAATHQ